MSTANQKNSYRTILKSSTLVGGASAINMILGAVRTKFITLVLGPVGFGVMGTYTSITSVASTLAGLGIGNSGVRQIAEAAGTNDSQTIARTIIALRRAALVLGCLGAVMVAALSWSISLFTFKSADHAWPIAILSLTVLFASVSGGQVALVQGMRRIADLSRINVIGGLLNTLVGLILVYWLGKRAIVPLLLAFSLMTMVTSWWYARKIPIDPVRLPWRETWAVNRAMLTLGFAFLISGVLTSASAYLIRVLTMRELGAEAAGFYQAAFTLAGLYAGFILQAMGADFYPRLTAASADNSQCNRMVNEQLEISLLLAAPGVLVTMALAPLVIRMFYSGSFDPAVVLLRWFALGLLLRILSWPLGFIVLAKGLGRVFICAEVISNVVYVLFTFLGIRWFGLAGTAMAFLGLYVFYFGMIAVIAWKLTRFRCSRPNLVFGAAITLIAAGILGASFVLGEMLVTTIGFIAALLTGLFCIKRLAGALRGSRFEPFMKRWMPKWLFQVPLPK